MEREKREPEKGKDQIQAETPGQADSLRSRKSLLPQVAAGGGFKHYHIHPGQSLFHSRKPQYRLGEIADRNVKAKHDFLIEDEEATTKKREEAVRQAPIVYDLDERITNNLIEKLDASFKTDA